MNALQYAQAALDRFGYLVMGSNIPHRIGDIIDDRPLYRHNEVIEHPTVVVGDSNLSESQDQTEALLGYRHKWRSLYYYRVTAE